MKSFMDDIKWADLRRKALRIMDTDNPDPGRSSSDETIKLLNELDIYRIELELENRRVRMEKGIAEKIKNEYIELFDYAPVGYVTLTTEKKINRINLTAAIMIGKDRSFLIDQPFDICLSKDSTAVFHDFIARVFENKARETCEVSLPCKGLLKEIEISGTMTEDARRCLITLVDITGHKNTQSSLKKSKEKAETADRMKSSFLSTMSHEFRTPLNSIIGFSGILLQEFAGALNPEQKKQLGMIQASGRHLLSLINDLLDLSRIEAGQLAINLEYISLKQLIEDVVKLEWPFAMNKGINLDSVISPDIDLIKSDKQRLHQILLNLINNAIKFTESGSVRVNSYSGDGVVKIEVIDTGIGIEKQNLDKIFEPFIQVENELTRSHTGSGLGLSVSRKLIELLKGSIDVVSEFGKGTTFTITIPVV